MVFRLESKRNGPPLHESLQKPSRNRAERRVVLERVAHQRAALDAFELVNVSQRTERAMRRRPW